MSINRQNPIQGFNAQSKLNPRRNWKSPRSTKRIPYVHLDEGDIRALIAAGYRVRSRGLYVLPR